MNKLPNLLLILPHFQLVCLIFIPILVAVDLPAKCPFEAKKGTKCGQYAKRPCTKCGKKIFCDTHQLSQPDPVTMVLKWYCAKC